MPTPSTSTRAPEISVIVPVHNVAPYLEECAGSILEQSFSDFELIIVDDGSTDETLDIANRFAKNDYRVSVYRQSQMGAGVARNTGMKHAIGRYLLFFDGDDIMMPAMLEKMHERATATEADITVCYSIAFPDDAPKKVLAEYRPGDTDPNAVRSGASYGNALFHAFVGWPWDKLIRASFVKAHSLEFQALSSTNDAYFVFTALAMANSIALVPTTLVRHRMRDGSIEATGCKTPHNAYAAYRAIESRLQEEHVDPCLIQGCHNWGLTHLRWLIDRYSDSQQVQSEIMDDYLQLASDCMNEPNDHYLFDTDLKIREMLEYSKRYSPNKALLVEAIENEKLHFEIDQLRAELDEAHTEAALYRQKVTDFEQSPSFRLGRAITAVPRAIRNRIAR